MIDAPDPPKPAVPLALSEVRAVLAGGKRKARRRPPIEDMPAPTAHQLYVLVGEHLDASQRHQTRWEEGEEVDADSGLHPLAHSAARMLLALEAVLRWGRP